MGKKVYLSHFECSVVFGDGQAGQNISETDALLRFPHKTIYRVYRERSGKREDIQWVAVEVALGKNALLMSEENGQMTLSLFEEKG